jgi:hypothetical protein
MVCLDSLNHDEKLDKNFTAVYLQLRFPINCHNENYSGMPGSIKLIITMILVWQVKY